MPTKWMWPFMPALAYAGTKCLTAYVAVYEATKCVRAYVAVGYNIANKQVLNVFPCYGTVAVAQLLVAWVWLLPQFALGIRQASLSRSLSLSPSLSLALSLSAALCQGVAWRSFALWACGKHLT